jgi:hypothetical protein
MADRGASVQIQLGAHQTQNVLDRTPFHEWVDQDQTEWASFYRLEDGFLARFPGLADFRVSDGGGSVEALPVPGVSDDTVQHLYLNQIVPLIYSQQSQLVLHGSAVEIGDASVAFLGPSGRGKSTLAAIFVAAGQRFLTDDGMVLSTEGGQIRVRPSHPSIRLWSDSRLAVLPDQLDLAPAIDYSPKARLIASGRDSYCPDPRPLRACYVLEHGGVDRVRITPVSSRDAMIEMARNCFLLDVDQRTALQRHYAQLLDVAGRVPFFHLDFPRRFEQTTSLRDAITEHVRSFAQGKA